MRTAWVLGVLTLVATLGACGGGGESGKKTTTTAPPKGNGRILVTYAAPKSATDRQVKQLLTAAGVLEATAELSDALALPYDVEILVEPGEPGPYYDPKTHKIHVQYGFVALVDGLFKRDNPKISPEKLAVDVTEATEFIAMHELGHALIDAYDLPVLGKEEDAVDALATVFMTEFVGGKIGTDIALEGASLFASIADDPKDLTIEDFADEHSLDIQRVYSILCWVAGSNQKNYDSVAASRLFTQERLERCPSEYQEKVESWVQLLKPHLKSSS